MTAQNTPRIAYKGFDKDLKCRGFQYEVGHTYIHQGEVKACKSGFHSCENPFDVLSYYSYQDFNRFAVVELKGDIKDHASDSKLASAEITIKAELTIPQFVQKGVDYILDKITDTKIEKNTGNRSAATNTGDYSAATTGGKNSVSLVTGRDSKAKASLGSAIFLVERDEQDNILNVFAGIAKNRGKIRPDTFYMLIDGKPTKVEG